MVDQGYFSWDYKDIVQFHIITIVICYWRLRDSIKYKLNFEIVTLSLMPIQLIMLVRLKLEEKVV